MSTSAATPASHAPRRSRWRTAEGITLKPSEWLSLPQAGLRWILLNTLGRRVERPWIPPAATRALAEHLTPQARVLEIGAGNSTLWLAPRCAALTSFESDQAWFEAMRAKLAARNLAHVDLQYRWVAHEMADFSFLPDASLDLCLVDGGPRLECAQAAVPKLKPGGWLYLDNADTNLDAKQFLLDLARQNRCSLRFHRGFPPACLYVTEGIVAQFLR